MNTPYIGITNAELLSALVDGEPRGDDLDLILGACQDNDSLLECWSTYHLVSDALRFPTISVAPLGLGFRQRFAKRLAVEPDHVAKPSVLLDRLTQPVATAQAGAGRSSAANDHIFKWKLLAGFASLTAVAAISWNLFYPASSEFAQIAVSPSANQILVTTPQGALVRDARLHEWMEAHRQLGSSPTQMPSGFLRSATFEMPPGSAGR